VISRAEINELTEEKIGNLLRRQPDNAPFYELNPVRKKETQPGRCAAVLVPLARIEGDWHLLLIKRTETVADHKGQVAFPGGACETEDISLEATALRETEEEVGIPARDIRVLGCLRELITVSGFCVAPIVGVIQWPYPLVLSPDEVSRAFTMPLGWLSDPENRETRTINRQGRDLEVIYYKPYDGEVLWGATARMVHNFLEILG